MKVGIIILNYNTGEMTRTLAKCVSEYKKVDDVVIVDNASTDDSITRLSEAVGGKIHLIQSGRNGEYSFGNNVGAKFCKELGTVSVNFKSGCYNRRRYKSDNKCFLRK